MSPRNVDNPSRRASWIIWIFLAGALGIFALASMVIYYRVVTTPQTDCGLIVVGNPDLEGFTVRVDRVVGGVPSGGTLTDTLNSGNGNAARFFLPSGTYRVQLFDKDMMLLGTYANEFIPPGTRMSVDLSKLRGPATLPSYRALPY